MQFSQSFEVGQPVPVVWALFQDVPSVVQCMPGAELTEARGDGRYAGHVAMKLGPLNPNFEGQAEVTYDEATHRIHLNGSGADRQGGSRGRVDVRVGLRENAAATSVSVDADVTLSGAAARFGRTGLIEEMVGRLITEFVGCLESKLASGSAEKAALVHASEVRGAALLFASLMAWLRRVTARLFRR